MQKDSTKDLRSRNLRNIAFITILVIVALLVLQSWYGNKAPTDEISFTSFETLVKQGKIVEVNIREDIASARTVEGETVTVRLPPDRPQS